MTKLLKTRNAPRTAYKKGQSGNPTGKPKGALNKNTINFTKIRHLASDKYEDAFNLLWTAMLNMEGWAHQIFFKELVPRKIYQPITSIEMKEGESRMETLIKSLSQFKELTHEELLNEIKVLSSKNDEVDAAVQQRIERESEEQLMAKAQNLRETIEFIEWKNKKNNSLH
jgi:hypothetical protein